MADSSTSVSSFDAVVIGGGQAGLSVGWYLKRQGLRFVILESHGRIGDSWRMRWDSLRLFTPARYDGLVGMPFPAPPRSFPTKDEMADYLEHYARSFELPVVTGVRVKSLMRSGETYEVTAENGRRYLARHVVVASGGYQQPRIPPFAKQLSQEILQVHSSEYRRPSQLQPGRVLVVGAGNSGAEIAVDLAASHRVWLAGRHPGHLRVAHDGAFAFRVIMPVLFRIVFHRVLTAASPLGRKARPHFLHHSGPLIRVKPVTLERAGVQRVGRVSATADGLPVLEDGTRLRVDNIVWCTGYAPGMDWIKLPVLDAEGRPRQYRGIAQDEPGLYFAGLQFQHSPSSTMVHGVARDAKHVADEIVRHVAARSAAEIAPASLRARRT